MPPDFQSCEDEDERVLDTVTRDTAFLIQDRGHDSIHYVPNRKCKPAVA